MSTYTVNILDQEIEVEVTYFYGGCPAKINALPEDCYPEEPPEVDWVYTDDVSKFVQEAVEANAVWQLSITEQLLDILMNQEPDDRY